MVQSCDGLAHIETSGQPLGGDVVNGEAQGVSVELFSPLGELFQSDRRIRRVKKYVEVRDAEVHTYRMPQVTA